MSDVGHARVGADFVAKIWAVMALTGQHTYQVLTKRPERLARMFNGTGPAGRDYAPGVWFTSLVEAETHRLGNEVKFFGADAQRWPLPNAWVGTSIESDDYVGRADALREIPAAVRFLSLEPVAGAAAVARSDRDRLGDRGRGRRPESSARGPRLGP